MAENRKISRSVGAAISYKIFIMAHVIAFEDNFFMRMIRPIIRFIDSKRALKKGWHFLEKVAKEPLFDCLNCGDCGLTDVAYICPMSQCPKNQRNGPCGGSQDDWCEVYPGKRKCIWIRAYQRFGSSQTLEKEAGRKIVLPQDWQLWQTASWLNFNLGRDHASKKAYIDIKK